MHKCEKCFKPEETHLLCGNCYSNHLKKIKRIENTTALIRQRLIMEMEKKMKLLIPQDNNKLNKTYNIDNLKAVIAEKKKNISKIKELISSLNEKKINIKENLDIIKIQIKKNREHTNQKITNDNTEQEPFFKSFILNYLKTNFISLSSSIFSDCLDLENKFNKNVELITKEIRLYFLYVTNIKKLHEDYNDSLKNEDLSRVINTHRSKNNNTIDLSYLNNSNKNSAYSYNYLNTKNSMNDDPISNKAHTNRRYSTQKDNENIFQFNSHRRNSVDTENNIYNNEIRFLISNLTSSGILEHNYFSEILDDFIFNHCLDTDTNKELDTLEKEYYYNKEIESYYNIPQYVNDNKEQEEKGDESNSDYEIIDMNEYYTENNNYKDFNNVGKSDNNKNSYFDNIYFPFGESSITDNHNAKTKAIINPSNNVVVKTNKDYSECINIHTKLNISLYNFYSYIHSVMVIIEYYQNILKYEPMYKIFSNTMTIKINKTSVLDRNKNKAYLDINTANAYNNTDTRKNYLKNSFKQDFDDIDENNDDFVLIPECLMSNNKSKQNNNAYNNNIFINNYFKGNHAYSTNTNNTYTNNNNSKEIHLNMINNASLRIERFNSLIILNNSILELFNYIHDNNNYFNSFQLFRNNFLDINILFTANKNLSKYSSTNSEINYIISRNSKSELNDFIKNSYSKCGVNVNKKKMTFENKEIVNNAQNKDIIQCDDNKDHKNCEAEANKYRELIKYLVHKSEMTKNKENEDNRIKEFNITDVSVNKIKEVIEINHVSRNLAYKIDSKLDNNKQVIKSKDFQVEYTKFNILEGYSNH